MFLYYKHMRCKNKTKNTNNFVVTIAVHYPWLEFPSVPYMPVQYVRLTVLIILNILTKNWFLFLFIDLWL